MDRMQHPGQPEPVGKMEQVQQPGQAVSAARPGESTGQKNVPQPRNVPHWKKRTWSMHVPPDLYPAAEEALKLPQFGGVRNVLLNRALRAYLAWLYKKGLINTDVVYPPRPRD